MAAACGSLPPPLLVTWPQGHMAAQGGRKGSRWGNSEGIVLRTASKRRKPVALMKEETGKVQGTEELKPGCL